MQLAQQLAMLLTLPLKRQNQLHRLYSQQKQLDHWLRVVDSMARLSRWVGLEQYKGREGDGFATRRDAAPPRYASGSASGLFFADPILLLQPYLLVMYLGWFGLFRHPCR